MLHSKNIVVSFKQNLRVINRTTNHYWRYDEDGKKTLQSQEKGDSWAIRKPMHKDTVYGEVNLRKIKTLPLKEAMKKPAQIVDKVLRRKLVELLHAGFDLKAIGRFFEEHQTEWQGINLKKIEVYYFTKDTNDRFFATRKPLDTSFTQKKITEEVTDIGIQKILLNHLLKNDNDANVAFSPDGIERMNQKISDLNDGKWHQPIYKVRVYEKADKFAVGTAGNKGRKYVEAAKGTNLFFAVYESEIIDKKTGEVIRKRSYASIPLNVVIDRQKKGLSSAPEDENGKLPIFVLSPNDLVYLPTEEEHKSNQVSLPINKERIYKMVSSSGNQCFFVKGTISNSIVDKVEFSPLNKMERAITGEMIKETCIPIKVDRLGNISFK